MQGKRSGPETNQVDSSVLSEDMTSLINSRTYVVGLDGRSIYSIVEHGQTIIREATMNRLQLEEETKHKNRPELYVVCCDVKMDRFTVSGKIATNIEMQPTGIILAQGMYDAICKFEEQNGRRLWLPVPLSESFDCQLGIERCIIPTEVMRCMIYRIRKDSVVGLSLMKASVPAGPSTRSKNNKKKKVSMTSAM